MSAAQSKTYRVCRFDPAKKSVSADFIKAAHDREAIAQAKAYAAAKCEIWDGKRLVASLEREQPAA
jgi:hypothetical protein